MKLPKAHSRTHTHTHTDPLHSHKRIYEYTHTHTHTHNYSKSVSGLRFPDLFHSFTFSPPTRTCSPSHYFSFCLLFSRPFSSRSQSPKFSKKRLKPDGASGRRKYLPHCEREENWNAMPRQISGIRFSFGFSLGRFGTLRGFSIEHALRCRAYPRETPTRAPSLSPYVEKLLRVSLKQSL